MGKAVRASLGAVVAVAILCTAVGRAAEAPKITGSLQEMEVMGVAPDPSSGAPVVYLRGKQSKRELSMFIGPTEAQGILLPLQAMRPPRPYTHDLFLEAVHRLKAKVRRVIITELRDNTYFANLILETQGQEITLDSRPSDAIALALREDAPILAAEQVFVHSPRGGGSEGENP